MTITVVLLPSSPLMEQVIRGCVVEQEDIRRDIHLVSRVIMFMVKQLMATMLMVYWSLMIVLVNTFGPTQWDIMIIVAAVVVIVHVLEDQPLLLLLWAPTTTLNQELIIHASHYFNDPLCRGRTQDFLKKGFHKGEDISVLEGQKNCKFRQVEYGSKMGFWKKLLK